MRPLHNDLGINPPNAQFPYFEDSYLKGQVLRGIGTPIDLPVPDRPSVKVGSDMVLHWFARFSGVRVHAGGTTVLELIASLQWPFRLLYNFPVWIITRRL